MPYFQSCDNNVILAIALWHFFNIHYDSNAFLFLYLYIYQDKDRSTLKIEQELGTALSEVQQELDKMQAKAEKDRNQLINEVAATQKVSSEYFNVDIDSAH